MPQINLSRIRYRAFTYKAGFHEVFQPEYAYASASVSTPTPTRFTYINSVPAISNAVIISPYPTISVTEIAESIASSVDPSVLYGEPLVPGVNSIASVTTPVIKIEVFPQITQSTASTQSPIPKVHVRRVRAISNAVIIPPYPHISVTGIAQSTASVVSPHFSDVIIEAVASQAQAVIVIPIIELNVLQLSLPEEHIDPLWAGNLSGQSYDDTMPTQVG